MLPLEGLTVLDLTRVLSGPYCTMLLGDMGARVIKIEQPGKGDDTRAWGPPFLQGESAYFLSINRNKESVTLDFKQPEGRAILDRLIAKSDVMVENFRPGSLGKLGLDYASLATRHPRLVYCSISGYGHTGPRKGEAGYDAVMQAVRGAKLSVWIATANLKGVMVEDERWTSRRPRGRTGYRSVLEVLMTSAPAEEKTGDGGRQSPPPSAVYFFFWDPICSSQRLKASTSLSGNSGNSCLLPVMAASYSGRPNSLMIFWLSSGAIVIGTSLTAGPG